MDGMLHRTARWLSATVLMAGLACASLAGAASAAQDSNDAAAAAKFESKAPYAILIDSRSGKVYYENHADDMMAPASMSKVMTMIMVFEGLKAGRLHRNDEFAISENAWRKGGAVSGGSTMYAAAELES